MTKEEAKEFYPILQAFAEGKVIECRTKPSFIEGTDVPNEWAEIKVIEFNDNKEYRIKPNIEPGSEYRPFNIDYSYDLKVISGKSLGKICQKDIVHIHIWGDFLKKNGWVVYRSEGEWLGYTWYKHQEYPFILKYNNILGICCVSFNEGKDYAVMIRGVDELQHILFALNINYEMKV